MVRSNDPYCIGVAFDDLPPRILAREAGIDVSDLDSDIGEETRVNDPVSTVLGILHTARRRRLRSPKSTVIGSSYDPTYKTFDVEGVTYRIIGDESSDTPMFNALKSQFSDALPKPQFARLDDDASYSSFRSARRDPYVASLEARLSALEDDFDDHMADHADATVSQLLDTTARGGIAIPLPLQDCKDGKIECWQDGNEILCTIRLLGPDGNLRMATTGAPVEHSVSEVVKAADVLGADPDEVLHVAPFAAQVLGASALIPRLCGAVEGLLEVGNGAPMVGLLKPMSDPSTAAAMALIQRGQFGDPRAVGEVHRLAQSNPDLIGHATACLTRAQRESGGQS